MSYTLYYYSSTNNNAANIGGTANSSVTVPDGQSQTVANLTFPGRNFSGYGSPVDQNFLSLAEHFASSANTGPSNPVVGQLWYDTAIANASSNVTGLKIKTGVWSSNSTIYTGSSNVAVKEGDSKWMMLATKEDNGSMAITGNLTVANNVTLSNNLSVSNNLTVTGNISSNNATIGNTLTAINLIATTGNITTINSTTINTTSIFASGVFKIGTPNHYIQVADISSTDLIIQGNVKINGSLVADANTSTQAASLDVTSAIINTGLIANNNAVIKPDAGIRMYYYPLGNTMSNSAFMGYLGSQANPKFIVASNVSVDTGNVIGNITYANFMADNIEAVTNIISPSFIGNLSDSTKASNVQVNAGNVTLSPGGSNSLIATSNLVTITGNNTVSSNTATASNAALAVTGGVYVSGGLRVAGNIYGTVVAPAGSTANIPTANVATLNTSGTATINTANVTTLNVYSTATINTLNVNTAATVNSLVCNTSIQTSTLTVSGASTLTGQVTTANITTGSSTTAGNLTGAWTLSAGSTLEATYSADLAERHHADDTYPTGTVMTVGGANEITGANTDDRVLGVVSNDWAYLMNGGAGPQETHPAVAYVGRVPVRVLGPISKHDQVSPFANGVATASRQNSFGWALETNLDAGEKLVLCIVK
jgi:hypothetical protein